MEEKEGGVIFHFILLFNTTPIPSDETSLFSSSTSFFFPSYPSFTPNTSYSAPSLLPLIHLIFLVLQHFLTLLLGSSFIHPLHSPSFPFSPPSAPLLTLLFPLSPSSFSFSSSSCSPLSSTFVFSSSLHHPALSIYGPVIFFFVVLLLLVALLVLLVDILIFLLFFSFSPFFSSSYCIFYSSSSNSYSPSAPTGKVGCEKLKTLCALNQQLRLDKDTAASRYAELSDEIAVLRAKLLSLAEEKTIYTTVTGQRYSCLSLC